MTVHLYAFTCGAVTIPHAFLLTKATGWATVPVPSYLIVHPKGTVLFDSGLNLQARTDPLGYIGKAGMEFNTFHFHAGEEISARLQAVSVAPDSVNYLVNSHLHYDHAGGNPQIPNAELIVQRREWEHAMSHPDDHPGYRKGDFGSRQKVRLLDGEYDIFGDGSVICFPTYGHTPGHQSARVRTENGEFVLCGDACYLRQSLEQLHLPGVIADPEATLAVFKLLRKLQDSGARIMFGHDAEFWATVPQAPQRLG